MTTILTTLLQLVASLLLVVQSNPSMSDAQKQQVVSFANQTVTTATQMVATPSATPDQLTQAINTNNSAGSSQSVQTTNISNPSSNIPLPPSQANPQYFGVLKNTSDLDVTKYNYLGTNVGPGLSGGTNGSCSLDTSWLNAYPTQYGGGFSQNICNNAGKSFVYSLDYKDANNSTCYHWDFSGKYQM